MRTKKTKNMMGKGRFPTELVAEAVVVAVEKMENAVELTKMLLLLKWPWRTTMSRGCSDDCRVRGDDRVLLC